MKISVFYDHVRHAARQENKSVSEILAAIRPHGITAVDLDMVDLVNEPYLPSILTAAGFTVGSIYGFFNMKEPGPMTDAEALIDTVVSLKTDVLVVPGFLSDGVAADLKACKTEAEVFDFMDNCEEIQNICRALSYVCGYGAAKGIAVGVEDFDDNKSPTQRISELKWFFKHTPGLGWNLDTGNFTSCNESLTGAVDQLGSYVYHVHCKDHAPDGVHHDPYNQGDLPAATGSGYLPMAETLDKLKAMGYNGTYSIEHFGAENQLKAMQDSGDFLSKWF